MHKGNFVGFGSWGVGAGVGGKWAVIVGMHAKMALSKNGVGSGAQLFLEIPLKHDGYVFPSIRPYELKITEGYPFLRRSVLGCQNVYIRKGIV